MITVCTVTLDAIKANFEVYFQSVTNRTKLVSEVLVAHVDKTHDYYDECIINNIIVKQFGIKGFNERLWQGIEHGLGLHACIDRSTNDWLLFHDPDVFFYEPVDEIFYNLSLQNSLDIVGVSHPCATLLAYSFFPYLSCSLVNKNKLPSSEWLKGKIFSCDEPTIRMDGKYLIRMNPIKETLNDFPNPKGDFDTGSYLCLWAKQNNWSWLSFQTMDIHNYYMSYNRGNKIKSLKLPKTKLLYHQTSCTSENINELNNFLRAWEDSKLDKPMYCQPRVA